MENSEARPSPVATVKLQQMQVWALQKFAERYGMNLYDEFEIETVEPVEALSPERVEMFERFQEIKALIADRAVSHIRS